MKIPLFILLLALGPVACTTAPESSRIDAARASYRASLPDPVSQKKVDEALRYVQQGLPFPVEIDPFGAIYNGPVMGGELQRLKEHFLLPIARSRYAAEIKRVQIDAFSLEWLDWTCTIELKDMAPVSITHWGGLYYGNNRDTPDGYVESRRYALAALDKIGDRVRVSF